MEATEVVVIGAGPSQGLPLARACNNDGSTSSSLRKNTKSVHRGVGTTNGCTSTP